MYVNNNKKCIELIKNKFPIFYSEDTKLENENISKIIESKDIKILIIDQSQENLDLCKYIKNKFNLKIFIVALDYFNYNNSFIDIFINLFNHNSKIEKPENYIKNYYEGLEYAIVRKAFNYNIKKKKQIKDKAKKILIAFGGSDPKNHTLEVLKILKLLKDDFSVDIIIGPSFENKIDIIQFVNKLNGDYKVHQEVPDIQKYIFDADLGFVGAGTTCMEFCALGTPVIVFPQNQLEKKFSIYLENMDLVELIDEGKNILQKSKQIHQLINNKKKRTYMSVKQKNLIDGNGIQRIRNIILTNLKNGV